MAALDDIFNEEGITETARQLILGRFGLVNLETDKLYTEMTNFEYVTMEKINGLISAREEDSIYMKEIAEDLNVSVNRLSHTIGKLEEEGLIIWKRDPEGKKGTYIQLSEGGKTRLEAQKKLLQDFYRDVIGEFGVKRASAMAYELLDFDKAMRTVLENYE